MRGQRETSLDLGQDKDLFPFAGLRLVISFWQPPRFFGYHPMLHKLNNVVLLDGGREKISLNPPRWQCSSAACFLRLPALLGALELGGLTLFHCRSGRDEPKQQLRNGGGEKVRKNQRKPLPQP
ncbi:hypothetical protein ZWY2020_010714 [Hordeum vulgare]|nr:hypothetical protein ZWY2020_010714 [Hordeum vulgare]